MAPEVFGGGGITPRTDVFGLAATLWTLIGGRRPVYAEPTSLQSLNPEVSAELEQTITAGLEMIPERRIASAAAFARALGAPLLASEGVPLVASIENPDASRSLIEAIARTARRDLRRRRILGLPARRHHRRARLPVGLGCRRAGDRRRAAAPDRGHRR